MSDVVAQRRAQLTALANPEPAPTPDSPRPLPTEDEFFGTDKLPSEDEFFGPSPRSLPGSQGAELAGLMPPDASDVAGGGSRVLGAFGQGVAQGWGASAGHFGDEIERVLAKAGILKDVKEGQGTIYQTFNGAILRPAATAIDWTISGFNAGFAGFQAGVAEAGKVAEEAGFTGTNTGLSIPLGGDRRVHLDIGGAAQLGRDIAAAPEAFQGSPHIGPARPPEPVARILPPPAYPMFDANLARWEAARVAREDMRTQGMAARDLSTELYEAYAEGVIGRGERAYFGLEDAYAGEHPLGPRAAEAAPELPQQPTRPSDVHGRAREIAPDTFAEYDALADRKDVLRGQIADAQTELQRAAEAQAPGAAEIADLRSRLQDTTPRLAKKYQVRLDELQAEHDAFLADGDRMALLTRETPEIAAMRRELQEADYRMRDLSPEVSSAYREAAKDFPEVAERAPEPAVAAPEPVAEAPRPVAAPVPAEAAVAAPEAPRAAEPAAPVEPPRATQAEAPAAAPRAPVNIAEDVAAKLRAAGRPADEAAASAAIVDAYWSTRAAHLGEDAGALYERFGSDIRAGGEGGSQGLAQGKIRLPAAERARELAQNRAQTETPEFKRWFGDSKVVDEAGEPLVVYHGTTREFDAFQHRQTAIGGGHETAGFYFTPDARYGFIAGDLGEGHQVVPTFIRMEHPYRTDSLGLVEGVNAWKDNKAWVADLKRQGYDGIIYSDARDIRRGPTGWGNDHPQYVVFDPEQIKSAIGNRGTFDPADPRIVHQGNKGQAALANGRAIITLFDKADASTFMHETGHEWLERMIADGANPDGPAGFRDNAATVRNWLGMDADQAVPTTRQHERFARAFEQYLREGHAPSRALDGVFAQFRDWLTRIYETIKRLGKPINEDIRGVFDRLIAEKPERAVVAPEREMVTEKPKTGVYVSVPKPPESLLSFLKRKGGLKDVGGDVASVIGGTKGRPGLINKQEAVVRDGKTIYRGGMEMDEAARQAWEAGYFPEHADVPDHHALLAKIEAEARGDHQYSEHDAGALEAHRYALESNAEVDRLAFDHGIGPAGMTREQFFDRVAEKVAEADLEAEISNAATHVDEFTNEARQWLEEYATDRAPRTMEDLEREWRESERGAARPSAGGVESGQRSDAQPGRAGGPVQGSEGKPGPGGSGASDGGSSGPKASVDRTEAPANPSGQFDTPASGLVDKAGNIRIDNLNIPEDVARAIRDAAEQNADFIGERRGVVSDSQVLELADALGMTPEELGKRQIGEAYNAEQVMAARKLLVQSATDLRDLARKAAEGGEADILAFAAAKARHRMIQGQVAGITAEAGRALRAFRMLGGEKSLVEGAEAMMRDATGRTLFQMQEEAKRMAALDTPGQVSKFARDSEKPGFKDMIAEFWINSLLSGPQTHMANVTGNSITAVNSILETGIAGAVGAARRALGGKGGVELVEARAELFGLIQGAQDGLKVAGKAFREKDFDIGGPAAQAEMFQFDPRRFQSIPSVEIAGHEVGGKQLRIPTRALTAEDAFFRSIAYRKSINGQAYRAATQEGLEGNAFASRVAELTTNPSEAMMAEAVKSASYATFTNELGNVGRAMQQLSNSHIVAKFLLPFIRTPINIAKYALERTPASLMSGEVRANLLGRNGPAALDMQVGRLAMGAAVTAGILGLAGQGLITGSGPDDPKEMALWRLSGKQPDSIRVGDTWYSVRRFDPLGFLFSLVADMHQAGSQIGEKPAEQIGLMLANSVGKSFLEGTGMKGLSDALKAATEPQRYGGHWSKSFLSAFYPFGGAMGQVARAIDPYARQTRTLLDEFKAKTPFLSQSLPPKYDIFGEPIPSREALGPDALSVLYMRKVNDDPVILAMTRLHIFPGAVGKKIRGVELTPDEYAEFAGSAGRLVKMQLDALVGVKGFTALPDGVQMQTITRTIESAREAASGMMQMHHPRLISESLDDKRRALIEGKKPK